MYSQEPRAEVYCFTLNLNISKLGYWRLGHAAEHVRFSGPLSGEVSGHQLKGLSISPIFFFP